MTDDAESPGDETAGDAEPGAEDGGAVEDPAAPERDRSDAGPEADTDAASEVDPDPASEPDQRTASEPDSGVAGDAPAAASGGEGAAPADVAGIDPGSIDPSELTVPERSLNPRIRIIWVVRAVAVAVVVGAVAWAADAFVLDVGPVLPAGVAALFLVLGVPHALLRYRVWRYEVREDALYLERGVVTRVRTVVPFVRIQHVDTSRGPIERATGLATSVVYTAGSRGADVTIPGLEADRAEDLQRRLKRLAIASEGDTAV